MKMLLVAVCALSSLAFADDQPAPAPVAYQVPIARIQGNLACTLGLQDQSIDCSAHVAAKGMGTIDMKATQGDDGNPNGFAGMDKVKENGVESTMMVTADMNKAVTALSMFVASATDNGAIVTTNMMSTQASDLQLLNVAPMVVDVSNSTAIKFSINFTLYAKPQASIVQSTNPVEITNLVLARVKPYILSYAK